MTWLIEYDQEALEREIKKMEGQIDNIWPLITKSQRQGRIAQADSLVTEINKLRRRIQEYTLLLKPGGINGNSVRPHK